jgi:CheY-like chemotaxis protein
VRDILGNFGYTVRTASGGTEALALMPTFEPDVVLLDVMMPGMSGDEVWIAYAPTIPSYRWSW